jgi:hypothetical protein
MGSRGEHPGQLDLSVRFFTHGLLVRRSAVGRLVCCCPRVTVEPKVCRSCCCALCNSVLPCVVSCVLPSAPSFTVLNACTLSTTAECETFIRCIFSRAR